MGPRRPGGADHRHGEGAKRDAVAGSAALARPQHPPACAVEIEEGRARDGGGGCFGSEYPWISGSGRVKAGGRGDSQRSRCNQWK